jgi:cobalamin synthase
MIDMGSGVGIRARAETSEDVMKSESDGAKGSFSKIFRAALLYYYVDKCKEQNYGVVCKERKVRIRAVVVYVVVCCLYLT